MAKPSASGKTPPPPAAAGPHPVRRVVVLRAGPPPARRGWREATAGVVGLLLLAVSASMAFTLPEETVLPPQFKVAFDNERKDLLPSQSFDFNIGGAEQAQRHAFEFNVTDDDVIQVALNVYFTDDLAASDPDTFRVELFDPDGNPQPPSLTLSNPRPRRNETNPGQFDAGMAGGTYTFNIGRKPDDLVVDGAFEDTEQSIEAAQEREHRLNTNGTWKVRVFLVAAGGCPAPTPTDPDPEDAIRGAACIQANGGQEDPRLDRGNEFTVGSFSYTRFTVSAERLD